MTSSMDERQSPAMPKLPNNQPHQPPSKVILKIILNRLKPEAEKIIAEEQEGFRPGRNTMEQIFNLRILCETYLQHQDLYHVFVDFKKAFDRVWSTMRLYNINFNLIRVIQNFYMKNHQCSLLQQQYRRSVQNKNGS